MLYPLHLTNFISKIFELANQIKVLTDSTNQSIDEYPSRQTYLKNIFELANQIKVLNSTNQSIDKYPSRQTYLPAGVSVSDPYPEPPFSEKLDTAPY